MRKRQGKYDEALVNYKKSQAISKKIFDTDDHSFNADTLMGIANVYSELGKFDDALVAYEKSL